MILSVTLSKPANNIVEILGKPYERVKIKAQNSAEGTSYYGEFFTKTQVFHQHFNLEELEDFLNKNIGISFKNCTKRTESEEITMLTNKKGKVTTLTKPLQSAKSENQNAKTENLTFFPKQKTKNYLLPEGTPVPFLVLLGIMNSDGKVISSKYDKFRQINRFLEFIDDVLPQVVTNETFPENPVRIADFGCGKSYLTFAVHYFLTEIKKIPCKIEGLDLKEEVIAYCNDIAKKLKLENLIFHTGNIEDYSGKENPDIIITLHACDTATDFALKYAVSRNAKVILSVPCCQHQINQQLGSLNKSNIKDESAEIFAPLLKWGIIKEKFSSLLTDAIRGQWLESKNYKVQMLEFIDIEHTPKNILIRAVKMETDGKLKTEKPDILEVLKLNPEIYR